MRFFLICLFCLTPFYLSCDNPQENFPSLIQALKIFYEKNGGSIEDLHVEQKEEPITEVKKALKSFLQDIKEPGEVVEEDAAVQL